MEQNDRELMQQLSRGPLTKNGFDARLVSRIEEALERPAARRHPLLRFGWHGAGVAVLAMLLLFAGLWHWSFGAGGPGGPMELKNSAQTAGSESPMFADDNAELHSALLLGLRQEQKDDTDNVLSSYRTLFIAPEEGAFTLEAQSEGIVMPYGQNFWKIETVSSEPAADSLSQKLIAYPLTGKEAPKVDTASLRQTAATPIVERLLFVGNKYVAVEQNLSYAPNRKFRWVKDMDQLAADSQRTDFDPETEQHVPLSAAIGEENADMNANAAASPSTVSTEQWSIIRRTGSWVAASAATSDGQPYGPLDTATLTELKTPLPESINQFDTLYPSWSQVLKIEPDAKDAYSSPNEDMLVVVLEDELVIYPYQQTGGEQRALRVSLDEGESLVMTQWAKEDKYVANWKKQLGALMNVTSGVAASPSAGAVSSAPVTPSAR